MALGPRLYAAEGHSTSDPTPPRLPRQGLYPLLRPLVAGKMMQEYASFSQVGPCWGEIPPFYEDSVEWTGKCEWSEMREQSEMCCSV